MRARKYEADFHSNADYYNTYEACRRDARVLSLAETGKGGFSFTLDGCECSILVFNSGHVEVFYNTLEELAHVRKLLLEVLVPKEPEVLFVEPAGIYSLVDKIRSLVQRGEITHDMSLDSTQLLRLAGWQGGVSAEGLLRILREPYPFGIEFKVSRVVAGCSRAEPSIENWLVEVQRVLEMEGFSGPCQFEWQENLWFELVKSLSVDRDNVVEVRVKAFLDGLVIAEAKPNAPEWMDLAARVLYDTLDKHAIPFQREIGVRVVEGPLQRAFLIAAAGLAILCACADS